MSSLIDILVRNRAIVRDGLQTTLALCTIVWCVGIATGVAAGVMAARFKRTVGIAISLLSAVVAAMPAIVLMFWFHYPLQHFLGIVVQPFITAAACLSIINMLLVSEIVRNQISEFPRQYLWAAKVAGLSQMQAMRHVVLPMVTRATLPGILGAQISMLQASIFASLISVNELFRACQRINSVVHMPVELFSALALFFVLICLPLHLLVYQLKRRVTAMAEE